MLRHLSTGQREFHSLQSSGTLLELNDVVVSYPQARMSTGGKGSLRAVDGVSLSVPVGKSVGLVGESGCGKTSLGRSIIGLAPLTSGRISVAERDGAEGEGTRRLVRRLARSVQIVFQDPYSSLDPRQNIGNIVAEPMRVHGIGNHDERADKVAKSLERVGLASSFAKRYPHELSGGQRQRVCVARALAIQPLMLVCDEPTSALDVSIQAQVVELLQELQHQEGLTYLFITHDLVLLPQLTSTVAVMYLGQLVEVGPVAEVLRAARHPYSVSLISAAPVLGRRREPARLKLLRGDLPTAHVDQGCPFRSRCWLHRDLDSAAATRCVEEAPVLRSSNGESDRMAACHYQDLLPGVTSTS